MTEQLNDKGPQYLFTSEELLDPEVGAAEIGLVEAGKFEEVWQRMKELAQEQGIKDPKMIINIVFRDGVTSDFGSTGQPYPIIEEEWEAFVRDVPEYCGDRVPKVYMVDGSKYTAGI